MTWPDFMPIVTGIVYVAASVGYWVQDQRGLGLAYFAYALANVGLLWAALESRN